MIPNFGYVGSHRDAATFGDDGSLVVGSNLDKFLPRWRIVEKSCMWHLNFKKTYKFSKGYQTIEEKNEKLANLSNLPNKFAKWTLLTICLG